MRLTIEYVGETGEDGADRVRMAALAIDLEDALRIARTGLPEACLYLGARGFRILNYQGHVLAAEFAYGVPPDP